MGARRWGPGERLIFETYTREAHTHPVDWITSRGIFAEGAMGHRRYEDLVICCKLRSVGATPSPAAFRSARRRNTAADFTKQSYWRTFPFLAEGCLTLT